MSTKRPKPSEKFRQQFYAKYGNPSDNNSSARNTKVSWAASSNDDFVRNRFSEPKPATRERNVHVFPDSTQEVSEKINTGNVDAFNYESVQYYDDKEKQRQHEDSLTKELADFQFQDNQNARQHEQEMTKIENYSDIINANIRELQAKVDAATKLLNDAQKRAQDKIAFNDQRAANYAGKIDIKGEQLAAKQSKDMSLLFKQFAVQEPSGMSTFTPFMSRPVRIPAKVGRYPDIYIFSILCTGVKEIVMTKDHSGDYILFRDGKKHELPKASSGITYSWDEPETFVCVFHFWKYNKNTDIFKHDDCCKYCIIQ